MPAFLSTRIMHTHRKQPRSPLAVSSWGSCPLQTRLDQHESWRTASASAAKATAALNSASAPDSELALCRIFEIEVHPCTHAETTIVEKSALWLARMWGGVTSPPEGHAHSLSMVFTIIDDAEVAR